MDVGRVLPVVPVEAAFGRLWPEQRGAGQQERDEGDGQLSAGGGGHSEEFSPHAGTPPVWMRKSTSAGGASAATASCASCFCASGTRSGSRRSPRNSSTSTSTTRGSWRGG